MTNEIITILILCIFLSVLTSQAEALQIESLHTKQKTSLTVKPITAKSLVSINPPTKITYKEIVKSHVVKHKILKPKLSILYPANKTSINKDTFQVRGKSSNTSLVYWSVDHFPTFVAYGTENWSFTVSSLSEGSHIIHISTIGANGSVIKKSVMVIIDTKLPIISITGPSTESTLDHISSINGTTSDNGIISSVKVLIDNENKSQAIYSKGSWMAHVKLYSGMHVVQAIVTDTAGNSVTSQETYFLVLNPKLAINPQ